MPAARPRYHPDWVETRVSTPLFASARSHISCARTLRRASRYRRTTGAAYWAWTRPHRSEHDSWSHSPAVQHWDSTIPSSLSLSNRRLLVPINVIRLRLLVATLAVSNHNVKDATLSVYISILTSLKARQSEECRCPAPLARWMTSDSTIRPYPSEATRDRPSTGLVPVPVFRASSPSTQ